jgi:hypothetical protein
MTMESVPRRVATSDSSLEMSTRSDDALRQRLALLRMVTDFIEELEREPASHRRLPMNEPTALATARAAANIAAWRSYLPEDCVQAMINDGWQWST